MSGYARVKVNGFDFDSDKPIQGEVYDSAREAAKRMIFAKAVQNFAAIDLILAGILIGTWWVHGGFWVGVKLMCHYASGVMSLVYVGVP